MSSLPVNAKIAIPDELERQQIFYWLQRISSLTAWRRIFSFYVAWAQSTEDSLRVADDRGWGDKTALPHAEYALILKCLAHCEEGVLRLARGDKRIFKFDANGELVMAQRMLSHWTQMLSRIEYGESRVNPYTPLWAPFCEALDALGYAWGECGPFVMEGRFLEDPAPTIYNDRLKALWRNMPFPPILDHVPDPVENVFVRTRHLTPCSGIWEPIKTATASKKSIVSLFTRTAEPQAPFAIAGAMNYLHGGSNAPPVKVDTGDDTVELETTWRLLWRDNRYEDGTVPAIEAGYLFVQPQAVPDARPDVWNSDEIMWLESGDTVPVGGKWLVEADLAASVTLQRGDKLPMHENRTVRWILAVS